MAKSKSLLKQSKQTNLKKNLRPAAGSVNGVLQWSLLAGILLLTLIVYGSTFNSSFVWDDAVYIQKNPLLYPLNVSTIFTSYLAGNYHPLTVLVHAIEFKFFGYKESGYHVVNVLIHLINTLLVFFVIRNLSQHHWIALIVALFFGIHPMHVESVAWIAELKDVLYTAFFLASLLAYQQYQERQKSKWYIVAIGLFILSLLSKGMAVSLPVVLILMDYVSGRLSERKAWLEKIPFFVLSIVFGIIAIAAQQAEEALHADTIPIAHRIIFALYGYITYIHKLIIPVHLSAYYPYPISFREAITPVYYAYGAIAIALLVLTWRSLRQTKKIFFGLAFFTVTIFLVLKLLPVGYTIMADRYSYVPSIGIFYLMGEGFLWLYHRKEGIFFKALTWSLGIVLTIFYSYTTIQRCHIWANSLTLWTDTIEKYDNIAMAYLNRGVYYLDAKDYTASGKDLSKALEIDPTYATAYYNRGKVYQATQQRDAALQDYNKAIELKPTMTNAYINRGNMFRDGSLFDRALADYNKAIELDPSAVEIYNNKGILYQQQGNLQAALEEFAKALQISPNYFNALVNQGNTYSKLNQLEAAMQNYNRAISVSPSSGSAFYARGLLYNKSAETAKACEDFKQAINLGYTAAQNSFNQFCK